MEHDQGLGVTFERAAVQAWRVIGLAAAAVLVVLALAELRVVVLPVLAALVLGTFLIPPVGWLARRGWPRGLAAFRRARGRAGGCDRAVHGPRAADRR